MGEAWDTPIGAAGSTHHLGLHLWSDLSSTGQGCRACPAALQYGRPSRQIAVQSPAGQWMNLHLAEIARTVAPGAHAVLLMDQAGWHMTTALIMPENISIIPLPAKCPELNPVENIWQFMRDNWLSNRIFESYNEIVDHCCDAWNKLIGQPARIMSIGRRQWAQEF